MHFNYLRPYPVFLHLEITLSVDEVADSLMVGNISCLLGWKATFFFFFWSTKLSVYLTNAKLQLFIANQLISSILPITVVFFFFGVFPWFSLQTSNFLNPS